MIQNYFNLYKTTKEQFTASERYKNEILLAHRFIYRKLSFIITPLFIGLKVSANTLTVLNLILLFICYGLLFFHPLLASILLLLGTVLDFTDGNLARYFKTASPFGKFFDGLCDTFVKLLYFFIPLAFFDSFKEINEFFIYLGIGMTTTVACLIFGIANIRALYFVQSIANKQSDTQRENKKKKFKFVSRTATEFTEFLPVILIVCMATESFKIFLILSFLSQVPFLIIKTILGILEVYRLSKSNSRSTILENV